MSKYFNKFSAIVLISIFIILFSLTVYSLISSNQIVRDAELIQYLVIADFTFFLILLIYLIIFLIAVVVSLLWVRGIDYMQKNHPDYKGLDLFDEEDKDEI